VLAKLNRTHWISATTLVVLACVGWLNLDGLAVRFGGTFTIPVSNQTFWLPAAIRFGLSDPVPPATADPLVWRTVENGFDVAWLDVTVGGRAVDGIALARIDPSRHRFAILQEPSGKRHLEDWVRETGAELIVNASYYDPDGKPATPVVDQGVLSGPPAYQSKHGAFVVKASQGDIRDLKADRWEDLFDQAEAGVVSYPLLLAPDGSRRAVPSQWLANRSFIGVDHQGRVLIGTTRSAFFSLDRLATFLQASIPDLKAALNLDGGPVASQAIQIGTVHRRIHGSWELRAKQGRAQMLPISMFMTAPMPVVIAVFKRV